MIAYNTTKLFYLRLLKKAKQWYARQLLTTEQFAFIQTKYKADFYTPNLFIKAGLFIFTWVAVLAAAGLAALLFFSGASNDDAVISFMCVLFGGGCTLLLEIFIKQKIIFMSSGTLLNNLTSRKQCLWLSFSLFS